MPLRSPAEICIDGDAKGLKRALIVVAIEIEIQAVLAHLVDTEMTEGRRGILYEYGTLSTAEGGWQVVVAQSGAGNQSAHLVVTEAHRDFEYFDLQLFIGIAGSLKDDIPIGSVVAADRVYNAHAGKSDDEFRARPHSINTVLPLRQAAQKVSRDGQWYKRIRCPVAKTLPAIDDYPCPMPPASFPGAIASGEQVLSSDKSEYYGQIKRHLNDALVVEMEGYGAMFPLAVEDTPAIIVRGVSDMCVGKTGKADAINQPIAAAHAAAFAVELMILWGHLRSSQARSRPPVTVQAAIAPVAISAEEQPADQSPRIRMVLSLDGTAEDYPKEKIDSIVSALRDITGDTGLTLLATESGSVHLIFSVLRANVEKLTYATLEAELRERVSGANVLGVNRESEYRLARALPDEFLSASRELLNWPRRLPNGVSIERPELSTLLEKIETEISSVTVILGGPGSGKSTLLSDLSHRLDELRIPVLAIKADGLSSSIEAEAQLRLHLGMSTGVVDAIEKASLVGKVALVIDQLDALASFTDLRTGRLNVLLNLVRRLGGLRNVHIVLSARTFEFEHDVRLQSINAESLTLDPPPWHKVLSVLENENVDAQNWPEDTRELLRVPQALNIFLQLKNTSQTDAFHNYATVLDRLWSDRILSTQHGAATSQLAMDIAEIMSDEEALWLSAARFDDRANLLKDLEAADVISRSGSRIGFRHQTLFDHALARFFVRHKGKLSSYVLERQASLFIRPKVWATLTYLRDVEPKTYQSELERIWKADDLRPHLRGLLIDFMGQQAAPSDFEEALLLPELIGGTFRAAGFRAIAGSRGWFERFAPTAISQAMRSKNETAWLTIPALRSALRFSQDSVLSLLEANWIGQEEYDTHTWVILEDAPTWNDRWGQLAKRIIGRTEIAIFRVDHLASAIAVEDPCAALQVIRATLDRQLAQATSAPNDAPAYPINGLESDQVAWLMRYAPERNLTALLDGRSEWNSLPSIAELAPGEFIEVIWPWFFQVLDEIGSREDGNERPSFKIPYAVDFGFEDEEGAFVRTESLLLGSIRTAVEKCATAYPEVFLRWATANAHAQLAPVQRLIAHGFSIDIARYAKDALRFLLEDSRRFQLGGTSDAFGTTKALLAQISSHLDDEEFAALERALLNYVPATAADLTKGGARFRYLKRIRATRLELISTLDPERLSEVTRKLIQEEKRAFPDNGRSRVHLEGGWIGSPMSAEAMRKGSNDDILNMFNEVPDSREDSHPRDRRRGGNVQLSREFAEFAKSDPNRAKHVIAAFRPAVHERAAGYALEAMAENIDPHDFVELVESLLQRGFDRLEFRNSVAGGIDRLMNRNVDVPESVLNMLEAWLNRPAADAPPEMNDDVVEDTKSDEDPRRSLLWDSGGFFVLPGGAYPVLSVLVRALLVKGAPQRERMFRILESQLETQRSIKVWRGLSHYLSHLSSSNLLPFAKRLFEQIPEFAETADGVRLLAQMQWGAPDTVVEMIEDWPSSTNARTQVAYGELVALTSLVKAGRTRVDNLVELAIESGPDAVRTGIAYTAVNLWPDLDRRDRATNYLVELMPHADTATWHAIADLFRIAGELVPDEPTAKFLQALAVHTAEPKPLGSTFVVSGLNSMLPHQATVVAQIAQNLINAWKRELGDIRTGTAASASELVDLAITLHRLGSETRELGTALFETLIIIDAYGARDVLNEIDNRPRTGPVPSRRRLPRSAGGGRRRRTASTVS